MANFVQTMKNWMRMCEHCDRNEKIGCVINGNVCAGFCKMKDDIDLEVVEAKVTAWTAEHPEPVYPTWRDALLECGLLYKKTDNNGGAEIVPNWPEMAKHIPADIAQKLGLQPKEG